MTSALLLLVASTWLDPDVDDVFEAPRAPIVAPFTARLLPRITLRFTHRAAEAWWADSLQDALTTPLGTTFEVRLEWGSDSR